MDSLGKYLRKLTEACGTHSSEALLVVLGICLLLINVSAFYPGMMSADSVWQLAQAGGITGFSDWHPPLMSVVWQWLIYLTGKPGTLLVMQLVVLWLSLTLTSIIVCRRKNSFLLGCGVYLMGLLPSTIAVSGSIWKDVHMAFSLLFAVSLAFLVYYSKSQRVKRFATVVALVFAGYALNLRHNSLLALMPIFWIIVYSYNNKRSFLKLGLTSVGVMVVSLLLSLLVNHSYRVQSLHPEVGVMIDDIVHVASEDEVDDYPTIQPVIIEIDKKCQMNSSRMNAIWECTNDHQWVALTQAYSTEVRHLWWKTVSSNPITYAKYRLSTFREFLFSNPSNSYIWNDGVDKSPIMTESGQPNWLTRIVKNYIEVIGYKITPFLFIPVFWISLAIIIFIIAKLYTTEIWLRCFVVTLSLSVSIYIFGYFPMVLATDFRYIYWPALATPFALYLMLVEGTFYRASRDVARKSKFIFRKLIE